MTQHGIKLAEAAVDALNAYEKEEWGFNEYNPWGDVIPGLEGYDETLTGRVDSDGSEYRFVIDGWIIEHFEHFDNEPGWRIVGEYEDPSPCSLLSVELADSLRPAVDYYTAALSSMFGDYRPREDIEAVARQLATGFAKLGELGRVSWFRIQFGETAENELDKLVGRQSCNPSLAAYDTTEFLRAVSEELRLAEQS